jgi:uncharacterized protein with PIN domain
MIIDTSAIIAILNGPKGVSQQFLTERNTLGFRISFEIYVSGYFVPERGKGFQG